MGGYRIEGDFEIPAEDLWRAVRDFGDVSWLPGRREFESEGHGPGMIRSIQTPRNPLVRERLDAIDEAGRAIHYAVIEGNPMPVRDYRATMKVVDLGPGRCRLDWSSTWEPNGVTESRALEAVAHVYGLVLSGMQKHLESRG